MSNNKKLIPKRRFNRFEKDKQWFIEKLSSFANFSKGNGYSKNDLCEQGLPILLYGRLYTQYETIIRSVDTFIITKKDSTVFSSGDEVVIPASGETAKDIARASFIHKSGIIIGGDLNIIKPKNKVIPNFLAISLSSGNQKKELIKRAQGKTVVHLHNSELKDIKFIFPTKNEQTQIGEFFKKLDTLIQTQQKKLEKTKTLKSAYLAEMFPKDDESKPKLRFKGMKDNWMHTKLKDVIERELKGKTKATMLGNENIYLDANYLNGGEINYVNASKDVTLNDVLILWDGSLAGTVYHGFEGALGSTLKAYKPKESGQFLYQFLKKNQQNIFDNYRTPNIPHVIKTFTEEFRITIPGIKEQTKIGNFFKLLDKKIALEQRKLEKLNNIKQAYLNEMFV
ncbi:Restriction endonuclease [Gilliamella apicola SCGC AB-598-I20]|nr:Restriction endonuclease [Gilliamella apicola SCGC AB-598-I20]KES17192.1 Restriction endonuclease [Gilliamella apicola SCGC AB-598-I20]